MLSYSVCSLIVDLETIVIFSFTQMAHEMGKLFSFRHLFILNFFAGGFCKFCFFLIFAGITAAIMGGCRSNSGFRGIEVAAVGINVFFFSICKFYFCIYASAPCSAVGFLFFGSVYILFVLLFRMCLVDLFKCKILENPSRASVELKYTSKIVEWRRRVYN